ncbi:DNA polymerase III subunit delta [Oceanibacterium hippocampi]|uniref:DNA-directed DNA polymerase n=1 Tax=Oceanibacterium hippocampi TaxID=745714 RepID=A0A1Y5RQZ3_9PROT|nr:DNA polymerase III subunit delta [Oceanibacterium hippocampi]SLN20432.1 DNA polymerase III subunit delta [Oceanibacterium hippocampi]
MRFRPADFNALLRDGRGDIRALLLYGPDEGLVRERARAIVQWVLGAPDDPFRLARIDASELADDPARLADEAAALAFTGGRRLVHVRDGSNRLTPLFKDFFADAPGQAFVLVEAGALRTRDSLPTLFEKEGTAAVLPCYPDEPADLAELLRDELRRAGIGADPDALAFLQTVLGQDRAFARNALEKLRLYKHGDDGPLTLQEARDCVADSNEFRFDAIVRAAMEGDQPALDRALDTAFGEGMSPVAIFRVTQNQVQRLLELASSGRNPSEAIGKLRPPLPPRAKQEMARQLRLWPRDKLAGALRLLLEAELDAKSSGLPDQAICRHALMRLATAGRVFASGRR